MGIIRPFSPVVVKDGLRPQKCRSALWMENCRLHAGALFVQLLPGESEDRQQRQDGGKDKLCWGNPCRKSDRSLLAYLEHLVGAGGPGICAAGS